MIRHESIHDLLVAAFIFCMQFISPVSRKLARRRGDDVHDEVGMKATLLVIGWIPSLVVAIVQTTVYSIYTLRSGVGPNDAIQPEATDRGTES